MRPFDTSVEECAKQWRAGVEWQTVSPPDLDWTIQGNPGDLEGVSAGYRVRCGEREAFAKPSKHLGISVAAHEKIAADLAFDLKLPVPPVVLWDRADRPDRLYRYCSVSLVPFDPADKWRLIDRVPSVRDRVAPKLGSAASAMIAFDTWIGNTDRMNEGNLIVSEGVPEFGLRYAYIDHANAMSHAWGDGPAPETGPVVGPYPQQAPVDAMILSKTVAKIEALSDCHIRTAVDRIPAEFINYQRKQCIREGLCRRRTNLRGALAHLIGAIS